MFGFFEDSLGDRSMMRLIAFIGCVGSLCCILSGSVALIIGRQGATEAMAIGVGMFTSGAVAKYMQKRLEEKTEQIKAEETQCVEKA